MKNFINQVVQRMTTPSKLKVVELKEELSKLGLSTTGLKADLVSRLEAALNGENQVTTPRSTKKRSQSEKEDTPLKKLKESPTKMSKSPTKSPLPNEDSNVIEEQSNQDVKETPINIGQPIQNTEPVTEMKPLKENVKSPIKTVETSVENSLPEKPLVKHSVPDSNHSPTKTLKIINFKRPLRVSAVQELLGKFGKVTFFWMNQIKTHCYATFETQEQAVIARQELYHLKFPEETGGLLEPDFITEEKAKEEIKNNGQFGKAKEEIKNNGQFGKAKEIKSNVQSKLNSEKKIEYEIPPLPPTIPMNELFKSTKTEPMIYFLPNNL